MHGNSPYDDRSHISIKPHSQQHTTYTACGYCKTQQNLSSEVIEMASKQSEQTPTAQATPAQTIPAQTAASPGSPTQRRLSLGALGGGNDGMGGPIYKVPSADPLSHAYLSLLLLYLFFVCC